MDRKFFIPYSVGVIIGVTVGIFTLCGTDWYFTDFPVKSMNFTTHNEEFYKEIDFIQDTFIADVIRNKVKILCFVTVNGDDVPYQIFHINITWGTRCDQLIFASDDQSVYEKLDTTKIHFIPFTDHQSYKYINKSIDKVDWVLFATGQTYVIMENLRYMLLNYTSTDLLTFGYRRRIQRYLDVMDGDAGIVVSKTAFKLFVYEFFKEDSKCKNNYDQYILSMCLKRLKVNFVNTRDMLGRGRFFPYDVEYRVTQSAVYRSILEGNSYPVEMGFTCCSDIAISFRQEYMIYLEYFLYHMKPYGRTYRYPTEDIINNLYN